MSDNDLTAVHEQTCAILAKLYNDKGKPEELDDAFIQEYFKQVQAALNLDLDVEEDAITPRGPHTTDVRLSGNDRGLIEVLVRSKNEKFVVSRLAAARTISGTSQRFGSGRGSGTYVMSNVGGIPNVTINSGGATVTFVGFPSTVQSESGRGAWERA